MVNARSLVPCQDSPGVRFTVKVELIVPLALRGLMAASTYGGRQEYSDKGVAFESWAMDKPIPAYLLAIAVGDLKSLDLSPRSRVWAEPSVVEAAAREFDGVESMIKAAEELFGPYPWGRFDILIMPKSFPYGGMENPTLTFLTPAILAGDKSMVNVVIHELAHGWSGNLVTNATWDDFWLNESWTVYVEWRILEKLYGADTVTIQAALLWKELVHDLAFFLRR